MTQISVGCCNNREQEVWHGKEGNRKEGQGREGEEMMNEREGLEKSGISVGS